MTRAEITAFNFGQGLAASGPVVLPKTAERMNATYAVTGQVQDARKSLGVELFEEWVWKGQQSVSQR